MNQPNSHIGPLHIGMGMVSPQGHLGIGIPIMTSTQMIPHHQTQNQLNQSKKVRNSPDSTSGSCTTINVQQMGENPSASPPLMHFSNPHSNLNNLPPNWPMSYPVMGMSLPPNLGCSEPNMLYGIAVGAAPTPPQIQHQHQHQNLQTIGTMGTMGTMNHNHNHDQSSGKPKEIIHFKACTLFPPNPTAPQPTTREKPPGCRTVFIGGLPENCTEVMVREIFDRHGEITTVRMSKKNFCHVRFELEKSIESAIELSGYRIRIGSNSDAENTGKLHIDYAQARDDLYDWECRQRQLLREKRHKEKIHLKLSPSPPPPIPQFSTEQVQTLSDKLKGDETFLRGTQILIGMLERGDCKKINSSMFYSLIQIVNSQVKKIVTEKSRYDEELLRTKEMIKDRMHCLLIQFNHIEKVFEKAFCKKVWDHLTKAQRKNIDSWKKQAAEIKKVQLETALKERLDEEMDLSYDSESENEDQKLDKHGGKKMRFNDDNDNDANRLKDENDTLKCQIEVFKNEMAMKDQEIIQLQEQIKGKDCENPPASEKCDSSIGSGQNFLKNEIDARLIGLISTFLIVHPFGASTDYILSYVQKIISNVNPSQLEMLMSNYPSLFKQEFSGIGAGIERKWRFVGFNS